MTPSTPGRKPAEPSFGKRLQQTREIKDLSQTELAARSDLTPAAISQLEAGDRLPSFKTLSSLAHALGTSVGFLLGEEDARLPSELKAFFRDLQELNSTDVKQLRDYAAFLKAQNKPKSGSGQDAG